MFSISFASMGSTFRKVRPAVFAKSNDISQKRPPRGCAIHLDINSFNHLHVILNGPSIARLTI